MTASIEAFGGSGQHHEGCCGYCGIASPNVDIYYWPSPEANKTCLEIMGSSASPLLQGATYDSRMSISYWGYSITGPNLENSVVTSMVYTSIGGIHFKLAAYNPWNHYADVYKYNLSDKETIMQETNTGLEMLSYPVPRLKRIPTTEIPANSIAIPLHHRAPFNESEGNNDSNGSSNISTVVYNGFTL